MIMMIRVAIIMMMETDFRSKMVSFCKNAYFESSGEFSFTEKMILR